ncbi:hypothetical protein GCM10027271_17520 [Saccharopolyspora gloriosae]|uniref:Uncharacterized protein n=1 Tax=Saccharopolyspora gloriosae TaxID=455344 RepID=A0A840NDK3_9PSEU|nr:hypothetical protein [Saccharopolyspora gloriosae]MBB5067302.1 hypothetical protein [Saccharopolyspora gloriosae]
MRKNELPEQVRVPAQVAETPGALPGCCARHGRNSARSVDFALQSRAEPQGSRAMSANPLGVAGRLGERAQKVRITRVRDWPLCTTCARQRTAGLVLANALFWGGVVLIAGALAARLITGVQSPALGAALLGGFFAAIVSVVPFVLGSLPRITGARTSEDGSEVVLTAPHPAFVTALRTADDHSA